jgi:hypothetical protein
MIARWPTERGKGRIFSWRKDADNGSVDALTLSMIVLGSTSVAVGIARAALGAILHVMANPNALRPTGLLPLTGFSRHAVNPNVLEAHNR